MKYSYKKGACIAVATLGVAFATWTAWRFVPSDAEDIRRSTVIVGETSWNEIEVDGKPLIFFDEVQSDSTLTGVSMVRDSVMHRTFSTGFWANRWFLLPSCEGKLITIVRPRTEILAQYADADLLRLCRKAIKRRQQAAKRQISELDYYMRVHSVQDYGYQALATLNARVNRELTETTRALHLIDSLGNGKHSLRATTRHEYAAVYRSKEGKIVRTRLQLVATDEARDVALMQTYNGKMPKGVAAVTLLPWDTHDERSVVAAGFPTIGEQGIECDTVSPRIIPGDVRQNGEHNLPKLLASDGTPVFSTKGWFVGIVSGDTIITRGALRSLKENK